MLASESPRKPRTTTRCFERQRWPGTQANPVVDQVAVLQLRAATGAIGRPAASLNNGAKRYEGAADGGCDVLGMSAIYGIKKALDDEYTLQKEISRPYLRRREHVPGGPIRECSPSDSARNSVA